MDTYHFTADLTAEECFHDHGILAECEGQIKSAEAFPFEISVHEILSLPAVRQAARFLSAFAAAGCSCKAVGIARGSVAGRIAFA
jgi:hypothetical protein